METATINAAMKRVRLNGGDLAFEVGGKPDGEPVLLLACGFIADASRPLFADRDLASRYRLITYHRRGYGQSDRAAPGTSFADHASDAVALLDHLGVARAHVVGHSLGGSIALQLALSAPARVASLAVLEPTLPGLPQDPVALNVLLEAVGRSMGAFAQGRLSDAIDAWLDGAFDPGWGPVVDAALPGWRPVAIADALGVFGIEVPALQGWTFGTEEAARVSAPVLAIVHKDPSWGGFEEIQRWLLTHLPRVRGAEIAGTTHLLHLQRSRPVAAALAQHFAQATAS